MKQIKKCNFDPVQIILYITGDLDEKNMADIKEHLSSCKSCNSHYLSLKKENLEFPDKYPFRDIGIDNTFFSNKEKNDDIKIDKQVKSFDYSNEQKDTIPNEIEFKKSKKPIINHFFSSRAFYAIAASLIILVTGSFYFQSSNKIQSKGKPILSIYIKSTNNTFNPNTNNIFYPNNTIQFTYTNLNYSYMSLFSINEQGVISRLYPTEGDHSFEIQKITNSPIPISFKLDNYIGEEFYIGVFSEKKHNISDIISVLTKNFNDANSLTAMEFNDTNEYTFTVIRTVKKVDKKS